MSDIRISFVDPLPVSPETLAEAARQAFGDGASIHRWVSPSETASLRSAPSHIVLTGIPFTLAPEEAPSHAWIALGSVPVSGADVLGTDEWTPPGLARALRRAHREHRLKNEARRLSGDLLSIARRITHDLRTPVACIRTNAEMLREFPEQDRSSLGDIAAVLLESADEASALISRISIVLRASAEPVRLEQVDMSAAVAAALEGLKSPVAATQAEIVLPPFWPQARGVSRWLSLIWEELVRNGLRHGGSPPRLVLGWTKVDSCIRYSVTDSGPGLANEQATLPFVPFEELHHVRARGLGLSLIHRLVTLQGGHCGYSPVSGGGACFYFDLPVQA